MSSNQDLFPDDLLLHHIFPESQSTHTTILAQTFVSCTFVAHHCGPSGEDVVVRLELSEDSTGFCTVAALQTLAQLVIPELVPTTERYGTTTMANQKKVSFSVTKFIHDTVSLESVWDDMDKEQQTRIVKELFDAVTKLRSINLFDGKVEKILQGTGFERRSLDASAIVVGGPAVGYFTDIQGFLQGLIKSHCTLSLDPETGDVTIRSKFDDINPVQISSSDLQLLQHNIVLCHQDLEPRNILVHPKKLEDGTTHYRVAAILDWEMSGFFPFSYEYVCKDLFLGSANLFPTWYTLFKQHGGPLVPMSPLPMYQARFMEAIELIHYSWDRGFKPMSGVITKRWLAREGAVRQQPAGTGWLKDGNSLQSKRIPHAEMDKVVNQILKELGRI